MNFQELTQRLKQIDEGPIGAIDPVSNNPVKMQTQNVAPQSNRPGLAPKGDPKLWDIQNELRKRGYKIRPDGLNGPQTEKLVKQAQSDRNWVQDTNNPTAVNVGQSIGSAIGDVSAWIETTWRNVKQGYQQATGGSPVNESFNTLYKKIATLDGVTLLNEDGTAIEECGAMDMMAGGMAGMQHPEQPDSVSMNVSMNASGTGGIRDLMSVLHAIEQGATGGEEDMGGEIEIIGTEPEVHGLEIDAEPHVSMNGPEQGDEQEHGHEQGPEQELETDEEYQNEPATQYQDQEYMNQDLAGGADEPQQMHKGGYRNADNPMAMESLKSKLQALYTEIKEVR